MLKPLRFLTSLGVCLIVMNACTDYEQAEFSLEELDNAIESLNNKGINTAGLELIKNYKSDEFYSRFYSVYTIDSITKFRGTFIDVNEAAINFSRKIHPGMYFCQQILEKKKYNALLTYMVDIKEEHIFYIKFFYDPFVDHFYDVTISNNLAYTIANNGDIITTNGLIFRPYIDSKGFTTGFTNPDNRLFYFRDNMLNDKSVFLYRTHGERSYEDSKIVINDILYDHYNYDLLSEANKLMLTRYLQYGKKKQSS